MRHCGLFVLALAAFAAKPLQAQGVTLGGQFALGDYREQAGFLQFHGSGPAVSIRAEYGRFALESEAWKLTMKATDDATHALEAFTLTQLDVRARLQVVSVISVETGFMKRSISPERAAQEASAFLLGVHAAYALAPGANVTLRSSYVAGADFSGGGSAPFGIEVGLGFSYGPTKLPLLITGNYDFQRIDRRTELGAQRQSVPIQSAVARFGLAVSF